MNDRMKVRMNERMNDVCMSYYLNGNKHIKEKKKIFQSSKELLLSPPFLSKYVVRVALLFGPLAPHLAASTTVSLE
jgi:hypothetical protein